MAFNPDDFIAGISAAQTPVTIFKNAEAAGRLRAVETDLALLGDADEEQTLDAGAERAELAEKRDRLQAELQDSAEEFIVQAIEQDKIEEITKEARKAAKDRADQAAKDAAGYAREECKRAEIGDGKEIREAVRRASTAASDAILRKEAGIHILSHAVVTDAGERAFTPDQMRVVSEKLGDPQMDKLYNAFYELTSTDPGELIPKSRKPGPTVED
ncbi:hypothetical protein [Brevibacterium sp. CT2-23B]|uniref:hypothetical protein n=1 Tax=Brevibacterium sp. CT2-23B TaxID=2729630 RepID=UPI001551FACA|nr:hypothetical protein [Brevibacterium sp. CT2-23B]